MEVDPRAANVRLSDLVNAAKNGASSSHGVKDSNEESIEVDPINKKVVLNNGPYSEVSISYDDVIRTNVIEVNKEDIMGNEVVIENNDVDFAFDNVAQEHITVSDIELDLSSNSYSTRSVNRKIKRYNRGSIINNIIEAGGNELFDKIYVVNSNSNNSNVVRELSKLKIGTEYISFGVRSENNPVFIFDDIVYYLKQSFNTRYIIYLHFVGESVKLCLQKVGAQSGNSNGPIIEIEDDDNEFNGRYKLYNSIREGSGPIILLREIDANLVDNAVSESNVVKFYDCSNKLIMQKSFIGSQNYEEFILCDDGGISFILNGISGGPAINIKKIKLYNLLNDEEYEPIGREYVNELGSIDYSEDVLDKLQGENSLLKNNGGVGVVITTVDHKIKARIGTYGSTVFSEENWDNEEKFIGYFVNKNLVERNNLEYLICDKFNILMELYDEFDSLIDKYKLEIDQRSIGNNYSGIIECDEINKFKSYII